MQLINDQTPWYKRLKLLRVNAGLSQEALARQIFVQQRNYWAWENGLNVPREAQQDKIAAALGVDRLAIFGADPRRKEDEHAGDH